MYPADASDRLRLRIEEAQQAEQRAAQAAITLREQVAQDANVHRIESDIDRLEQASLDLKRRVAAARDAAADDELKEQLIAELDRLEQRAAQFLEEVRQMRGNTSARGGASAAHPLE